jgi:hypothetical protein
MTGPARRPWWYSGDDEEPLASDAAGPGTPAPDEAPGAATGEGSGGVDWTALVVGAQRVVEWATERVMAPHADHADPSDHPECVVCRTMVVLGEPGSAPPPPTGAPSRTAQEGDAGDAAEWAAMPAAVEQIQWIPIRDGIVEP